MRWHEVAPVSLLVVALLPGAAAADEGSKGLTDVAGIKVGSFTLTERPTGCTVILTETGATGGVDVRGGAPGTRETDLLDPSNHVQKVNAIVLSGGSAFGLDAASGAMRWLDEHGFGYDVRIAKVPTPRSVPAPTAATRRRPPRPTGRCRWATWARAPAPRSASWAVRRAR
jgi:L-aminopeptidase/D-esterase-like protein